MQLAPAEFSIPELPMSSKCEATVALREAGASQAGENRPQERLRRSAAARNAGLVSGFGRGKPIGWNFVCTRFVPSR